MENKIYKYLWKMSLYINQNKLTLNDDNTNLSIMDQWIIEKCRDIRNKIIIERNKEIIDKFFIDDFYKIYLLILDNKIKDNKDYVTSKNVLLNVYLEILKMYYRYYPNVVLFIFYNLYSKDQNLIYNDTLKDYKTIDNILLFGEDIKNIIEDVNKFRKDNNISRKQALDNVGLNIKKDDMVLFPQVLDDILNLINAKSVNISFDNSSFVEIISDNKNYMKKIK